MRRQSAFFVAVFFAALFFAGFLAGAFATLGALAFTDFLFTAVFELFFAAITTSDAVFYHGSCNMQVIA